MELRQLRYFEAVVRHRHFTRAAEELHVAQSALSHQVAQLERELGTPLLERTTRSVKLTEAGSAVASRARSILAEAAAISDDLDALQGLIRGRVAIGALLFGGELDIPGVIAAFRARHPGVDVHLRAGTAKRMVEMLLDGSLDLAFALEPEAPPRDLEAIRLSTEELALVSAVNHRLADRDPVRVSDLGGEPLIMFERGSSVGALVGQALNEVGAVPRIALEASDLALVRGLVSRGLALAILPRTFADLPGPPVAVRPLLPRLRMPVVLWWRSGRQLSPAALAFIEFAKAAAAE